LQFGKIYQVHLQVCKQRSDQALSEFEKDGAFVDEVGNYKLGRYLTSNEAVWRIMGFPI
jgi:hypothetical protein